MIMDENEIRKKIRCCKRKLKSLPSSEVDLIAFYKNAILGLMKKLTLK